MLLFFTLLLIISPLIVHEMGHWALLRRYNTNVDQYWIGLGPAIIHLGKLRIGMLPIGGAVVPEPDKYEKLEPLKKMWVALAGPIISAVYAAVLMLAYWILPEAMAWDALRLVAGLSLWLAVINIVPIPPLDGFQAWAAWRVNKGNPFSEKTMWFAHKVGSGMVYSVGFFVLAKVFFY